MVGRNVEPDHRLYEGLGGLPVLMRTPFAEALIETREAAGLTQRQLAERVGMSQQAIARWELGTSEPRPGALLKLRAELGEIMKRSNARTAPPVTLAAENRNASVVTRTGDTYQLDFVTDRKVTFPSIYDPPMRTMIAFGGKYPTTVIPSTEVLDREHRVAAVFLRELLAEDLQPLVDRLAAEPGPTTKVPSQ